MADGIWLQKRKLNRGAEKPRFDAIKWITALTPLISGVFIAGAGLSFTYAYNQKSLANAQLEQVGKLGDLLLSGDPAKERLALLLAMSIGDRQLAVRVIKVLPPERQDQQLQFLIGSAIATKDDELLRRSLTASSAQMISFGMINGPATPAELAVESRNLPALKILAAFGADFRAASGARDGPLLGAAVTGWAEGVDFLLNHGAYPRSFMKGGDTALHLAAAARQAAAVKVLLRHEPDLGAKRNDAGMTPLWAMLSDPRPGDSDQRDEDLTTLATLKALRAGGVDIGETFRGKSPIEVAATRDWPQALRLLLQQSPTGDQRAEALIAAAEQGDPSSVKLLLAAGAPVQPPRGELTTALHQAVSHPEVLRLLLRAGANVNTLDPGGQTPLTEALVGAGRLIGNRVDPALVLPDLRASVDQLLNAKADVNLAGPGGQVPLDALVAAAESTASPQPWVEIARQLLDKGADPRSASRFGGSLLMLATSKCETDIANLLLRRGGFARSDQDWARSALKSGDVDLQTCGASYRQLANWPSPP